MHFSSDNNIKRLGSHFDRLRQLVPYHMRARRELQVIINEVCNIDLQVGHIRLIANRITITTTPVKKAVIMRHKDMILELLRERVDTHSRLTLQ